MGTNPLFLESIAVLGVATLAAAIVVLVAMSLLRAVSEEQRVLLGELLDRQGAAVARAAYAPGSGELARALRCCASCAASVRCRSWLDSGAVEGYEAFCPNSGYVARLKLLAS